MISPVAELIYQHVWLRVFLIWEAAPQCWMPAAIAKLEGLEAGPQKSVEFSVGCPFWENEWHRPFFSIPLQSSIAITSLWASEFTAEVMQRYQEGFLGRVFFGYSQSILSAKGKFQLQATEILGSDGWREPCTEQGNRTDSMRWSEYVKARTGHQKSSILGHYVSRLPLWQWELHAFTLW